MIRVAASLTGLTVVFGLVLYLTLGDGTSPSTTATPSPFVEHPTPTPRPVVAGSPTPTPAPTPLPESVLPEILKGTEVMPLTVGDHSPLANDVALIVSTGCSLCHDPATGLQRIYIDPSGEMRSEPILVLDRLGLAEISDVGEYEPQVGSFAFAPDGSEAYVTVCVKAWCGGESIYTAWSPDAKTTIFRSGDGGVTWDLVGVYDRSLRIEAYLGVGQLLLAVSPSADTIAYEMFPSFEAIKPPFSGYRPEVVVDGNLLWTPLAGKGGPIVRGDGSTFLDLGEDASLGRLTLLDPFEDPALLLTWASKTLGESGDDPGAFMFMSLVTSTGEIVNTSLRPSRSTNFVASPGRQLIANVSGPWVHVGIGFTDNAPATIFITIDPVDGTLSAILSDDIYLRDLESRNSLLAVQTGPFARVDDTRSCLNLRTSPGLDAAKVACLADGVLLRHESVVVTNQDVDWLQVTAPDGTQGWAATEFLEY